MLWSPAVSPASVVVSVGSTFAGMSAQQLNGVVKISSSASPGSGALIDKKFVLTAAHVVDGQTPAGTTVQFDIFDSATSPARTVTAQVEKIVMHPSYVINDPDKAGQLDKILNLVAGLFGEVPYTKNDIAIIELTDFAPLNVGSYELFNGSLLGTTFLKSGYGRAGDGVTGDTLPSGIKRAGLNTYDRALESLVQYDFDNGTTQNDALGNLYNVKNLGLGTLEAITAPGDSGGPGFVGGKIASLTSYGASGGASDVNPVRKSFGDVTADVVVGPYISSFITPTLESLTNMNVYTPVTGTNAERGAKLLSALLAPNPGFTILPASVTTTGIAAAVSTYEAVSIGSAINLGAGALLTSGDGTPPLTNTSTSYGVGNGTAGDADLTAAAKQAFTGAGATSDVASLSFTLDAAQAGNIRFKVVFGSDEYPEYSNTSYVDIAAVFVNGKNYAYFGGNVERPLSVIQGNLTGNFINNQSKTLPIEYDGISNVLTITAPVTAGLNTIKVAVGDTGDSRYDSALWISELGVTGTTSTGIKLLITPPTNPDGANVLATTGGALDEEFQGFAGADSISAGGGNDVLDGGADNDLLNGGSGNDEIIGGEGFDTAVWSTLTPSQLIIKNLLNAAGVSLGFLVEAPSNLESDAVAVDTVSSVEAIQTLDGTVALGENFAGLFKQSANGDNFMLLGTAYSGPVSSLQRQLFGTSANEVFGGTTSNDFMNLFAGDDAANAGAGDDVVDGGLGSNFLSGGAGRDIFFSDGRGGGITWTTITDWEAGEQLSVWGWRPGVSRISWAASDGVGDFKGVTMRGDLDGDGTADTIVTWSGKTEADLPKPIEFPDLLWFIG